MSSLPALTVCFISINFHLYYNPGMDWLKGYYHAHFTDEETKAKS